MSGYCEQCGNTICTCDEDEQAPKREQQGCDYCNNPLFAGTKCNNCGRVTLAEPVKQEPAIPAFLRRPGSFGHE